MNTFFVDQQFDCYEIFLDAVRDWDLDFIQLGAGPFNADMMLTGDQTLQLGAITLNTHIHQRGWAPKDRYTFAIHHPKSVPHSWRFLHCPLNGITVYPDNSELQSVSTPGFKKYTLTFDEEFLEGVAEDCGMPELHCFVKKGEIALCEPSSIADLQQLLGEIACHLRFPGLPDEKRTISLELKKEMARQTLMALAPSDIQVCKKNYNRRNIAEKVLEYVEADISTPISVLELCGASATSERTLRNAFNEIFQTSPQKYQKCYRLNLAKRAIMGANRKGLTITDIAYRNGFSHMGQFAKDYFRLFGELPSQSTT